MKNPLKIFSLENLKENLVKIIKRFPLSVLIVLVITTIAFIILHGDFILELDKRLVIGEISLSLTFMLSIGLYLFGEAGEFSQTKKNLLQILAIAFGIIFYNIFNADPKDNENIVLVVLTFTGILSFLYFAPYTKNILSPLLQRRGLGGGSLDKKTFYSYFYKISVIILITYIFSGVLFGLGMIAIGATDALFNLNISEKYTYGNWAVLVFAFLTPLFFLASVPDKNEYSKDSFIENKFFSFIIKYLAISFVTIYFFILYAYSVKVLVNFGDWPKGIISWMIIGFSIFGYLAYSFSQIFEEKNKFIKIFRKVFPFAVLFQLPMLFYAIYLRIAQYDWTVNRYFVVVFGIWLFVVSLHFIFSKKKNLIVIPLSLFLITIIISIIPKYNIYSFPQTRQYERLVNDLQKAHILQNGKIVPLKSYGDIDKDLSKNIYSEIDYLCDFNNCEDIKQLFPKIYEEIKKEDKKNWEKNIKKQMEDILKNKDKKECEEKKYFKYVREDCFNKKYLEYLKKQKYKGPNKWDIVNKITEKIKVKNYFGKYFSEDIPQVYIFGEYDVLYPINVEGYKLIFRVGTNKRVYGNNKNTLYGYINLKDKKLEIKKYDKIIEVIDISKLLDEVKKRYNSKKDSKNWTQKDLTFKINDKYTVIFQNISFPLDFSKVKKEDNFGYYSIRGIILAK